MPIMLAVELSSGTKIHSSILILGQFYRPQDAEKGRGNDSTILCLTMKVAVTRGANDNYNDDIFNTDDDDNDNITYNNTDTESVING